jgi:WD40-like Beta Propeller Repeat
MRNVLICTASIAVFTAVLPVPRSSWAQTASPVACGSPTPRAERFAPTLTLAEKTFRGTIGPDHAEFYFFRKVAADPDAEDYRIFGSRAHDGTWSSPEQLRLGAESSDLYPALSPDGRRLVFTSYRRMEGDTASHPNAGLWYVDRKGGGWGEPVPIRVATELGSYHSQPVFLGDSLVFRRTSADWRTTHTLIARWNGRAFDAPTTFDPVERWAGWRSDLRVWGGIPAPDGSYVVLEVSELDSTTGGPLPSDLWVSVRAGREWTEPGPLAGGVNVAGSTENFPMVSPGGCDLIFVRDFSEFYRVSLETALARKE